MKTDRPTGEWRGAALLALASTVVFFTAFELVVRAVEPELLLPQAERHFRFTQEFEFALPHHRRDPVVGWRLVPGTYGRMHINAQGFRGRDFAPDPSAAPRRIALLGDSSTLGFTVPDDPDAYSEQLAARLRAAGAAFDALNFGVDGYSSHQGRQLLPEVLANHSPRYVTFYFGYNDHHYSNATDRESPSSVPAWRALLETSHAYRFARRHLLHLLRREAELVDPVRRVPLDQFEANLRQMLAATRTAGAVPVLLTTPLRPGAPLIQNEVLAAIDGKPQWVTQDWWLDDELRRRGLTRKQARERGELAGILDAAIVQHPEWPWLHWLLANEHASAGDSTGAARARRMAARLDAERRVMEEYNAVIRRVAQTAPAPLVDLAREFRSGGARLFNDVVHPNAGGHRLISERLSDAILALESRAIVPSPALLEGANP